MEALPDLQQVEIVRLAKDVLPGHYIELCVALGYSINHGDAVLASHQSKYKEATTQVLNDWNTKQIERNQIRSNLARKLEEEELGESGTKLSTGKYLQSEDELSNQEEVPGDSDIFGKKISESLTVGRCREKLRHKYLDKLCKIQLTPWDKSDYAEFKDLHTVVTMRRKDSSGRDNKKKEELEGSVDEIFSTKVNGRLPSRILISAPAGVGKTTAVAKIAYDWAQEKEKSALEQLPLLFAVKFRNTSHRTSIGEAIKTQLLSDVQDLSPDGIESFIRENEEICHIILDGLDEYAGLSSLNNIVSVIRCDEFPLCRVLITTRPHLESYFNQDDLPRIYTKMWIEGFSMEKSKEYIDRFFQLNLSDEKGEQLKEYLNDQPLIDELAKTPLFCLMICHLWSEDQLGSDVSTQTDLFDSVNKFLMHHANTRSTTSRLTFTHKNLNRIVKEIGRVALYGLLDDAKKLIFTLRDFRKIHHILDKACELGIISKTTVPITNLPQSDETTSTQIEFYHKLAQEHSAGKFIASETRVLLLRLRVSKLDRILWNINSNIGDYEELIRFAAGTNRHLGIRIMEALLANEHLEENERYRILLDCSSESKDSGGDMSSFVQRCVTAQSIILKSPTIYTVVGLQNLPKRLQREVETMRFVESVLSADVTRRMWSCLTLFPNLHTISITDSSLSFPSSPPELPSVTRLLAERMTPSCYTSVLLSLPHARELNASIVIENTSNTFEMKTDTNHMNQIVHRPHDLHTINVTLQQRVSQSLGEVNLGLKSGGLALLFGEQSRNQHLLSASGDMGRYGEILVDLCVKTTQLTFLNSISLASTHLVGCSGKHNLSKETTTRLWSCLRSFNSLNHLYISASSLSFPSSSIELSSVTKLSAEKVTSRSYKGLISSLPGLVNIDITMDDAEGDILQITAVLQETGGQRLERIILRCIPLSLPSRIVIRPGLLFEKHTDGMKIIKLDGSGEKNEEGCLKLLESLAYLASWTYLQLEFLDGWSFNFKTTFGIEITKCHLSSEMTARMWSCLRPFTSLNHLTVSDSSLSFSLSPPELPSVTMLLANKLTSQCYQGLIWSLPGLRDIDVQNAATDDFVKFVESSTRLTSLQRLEIKTLDEWQFDFDTAKGVQITKCRLSSEMTSRMWPCLRSFNTLKHLTISDSSLSFPPSPPELPSVTKLSVKGETSQCFEGLISSLPGMESIDITMDDAEEHIARYTTVRRIAGQKLQHIYLYGPSSPLPERSRVSRETMRGLGLFIKEHTQNLVLLYLEWVRCTDEDDLVYLIDCCRRVKTMQYVSLWRCRTMRNGMLQSHLEHLHREISDGLDVYVWHDNEEGRNYFIPHTDHVD